MPAHYMGRRQNATTRLPYDDYHEAVRRAIRRGWSLSQYIAYCVKKELEVSGKIGARSGGRVVDHTRRRPVGSPLTEADLIEPDQVLDG